MFHEKCSHDEDLNGATALGERRPAARLPVEKQTRVHGCVEGRGPGEVRALQLKGDNCRIS